MRPAYELDEPLKKLRQLSTHDHPYLRGKADNICDKFVNNTKVAESEWQIRGVKE